jgi:hypothetical protein
VPHPPSPQVVLLWPPSGSESATYREQWRTQLRLLNHFGVHWHNVLSVGQLSAGMD